MMPDIATDNAKKGVLLVGSGFGALKVAEDLATSGIPVVWVTKASHFLELPGGIECFSEWPEDINFQFRPLYLRVTRHPLVTPLTRARVEALEAEGEDYRARIVQDPQYIDYDLCTGCGQCIEVCPLNDSRHPPLTRTPAYCPSRALEMDKRQLGACRVGCPLGVNVQAYMALTAASRFEEALAVIKEDNPLPGICGRVCHHPCEESCRRSELDQAVAIRDIKRFLSDYEVEHGSQRLDISGRQERSEHIAVIGSGPAGLTAAHFLNRAGFTVTVFESLPEAGGMLRAGINAFRLPRKVLDAEIRAIEDSGVEIRTGVMVSSFDELFAEGFQAVLVATGTHCDLRLNITGEDLDGVVHCVDFLRKLNLEGTGRVKANTVVIGAGNSAMDAARTALRLGADTVTILAIETEDQIPAHFREVREASEEGVEFKLGAAPVAFEGEDGAVRRIICRPAHWSKPIAGGAPHIVYDADETFELQADTVIVAIGQRPHLDETGLKLETGNGGRVLVNNCLCTSRENVFAAGDVVTGPSSVIDSMAAGRRAAGQIIARFTGQPAPFADIITPESRGVGDYLEISEDIPWQWRPEMAQRQPRARRRDFEEVDCGFTTEQAVAESKRCLQCSACCECRICEDVCADIGAIDHFRTPMRMEVAGPSIIVADSDELTGINLDTGEGIFHLGEFKDEIDLMNVLVAGSAAAGQAMAKAVSLREAVVPKEPVLLEEIKGEGRLGFFLCACNGTMAPSGVMERIRDMAAHVPGVVHSETIFSACHPRGSDLIARAVREKGLERVILASCVCCPLEFQCISCNDQRVRARIHLFERLGLPRSHFEMVNIKDHLSVADASEDEMFERARYLLRAPFIRVHLLRPLRQGVTEIGSNVMILGGSEVGVSCARNLGQQGFKVRLIHRCKLAGEEGFPESVLNRPIELSRGRSVTHIEEAEIEEITGHVGDFKVALKIDGVRHRWQADVICLTDENVISLAILDDQSGLKKLYRYNFAFFHTPQDGLYRVMPRTIERVGASGAGAALAAQVATATAEAFLKDHELSPRVDPLLCRGCGRCADICPFDAIKLVPASNGIFTAEVVRHNCVGCGGCVGRCPVTALDIPYFSNQLLTQILVNTLTEEVWHEAP
jgi:NADPH-dependent glutamate synthase beta subunit-like oxidoreductase/NAD-dependent dihydropyrimidine dehydrogenase PreA subunit